MAEAVLRLDADDVWAALESVDTVALLAEQLIGQAIGNPAARANSGRLADWPGGYVTFEPSAGGRKTAMPAASLRVFESASLCALAARELVVPGGVTVAVLGTPADVQPKLAMVARHVPDIAHVAVCLTGNGSGGLDRRLVDQLDLAGIRLTVATTLADSVFGANLVVAASADALPGDAHLVRGAVLVNASGAELPAGLADRADQVYADRAPADHARRITADLGLLLTGGHPGRRQDDDIVLVELQARDTLNVQLAHKIHEAALRRGLGVQVTA